MASRLFECQSCMSFGKIILKGPDADVDSIAYCPTCGADISRVDDYEEDDDENGRSYD